MAASAASAGTPFGRYRLLDRLGEGGMAIVYRAVAEGPDGFRRSVVIKRVRPSLSSEPEFARMLAHEARVSALLHHPNVVQVYELGEVDGEQYLVMEYVDGVDLGELMRRVIALHEQLPVGLCCFIVSRVAAALAYAHDLRDEGKPLSIIHRDVSPSNIMVTRAGAVKLVDFGIAKAAASLRHEQTVTGVIRGKLGYLSPEQAASRPIDRRADIFSLGIVLYEILSCRRLFRGGDDLETINLVREAEVPPIEHARKDVSEELAAVVRKMLAREPEARFAHCDEVVAALAPIIRQLEGDEGSLQRLVERVELQHRAKVEEAGGVVGDPSTQDPLPSSAEQTRRGRRSTPNALRPRPGKVLALAAGIGALLATAGGIVLWRTPAPVSAPVAAPATPAPVHAPGANAASAETLAGRLDPAPVQPAARVEPQPVAAPPRHKGEHARGSSRTAKPAPRPKRDDELRPF